MCKLFKINVRVKGIMEKEIVNVLLKFNILIFIKKIKKKFSLMKI